MFWILYFSRKIKIEKIIYYTINLFNLILNTMTEEDYTLDQNTSFTEPTPSKPAPTFDDLQKDPLFQNFMKKMENCKTQQQKQNLLREIQEQIAPSHPDTRTAKEKLEAKKRLLKNQRTKKNLRNNTPIVKPQQANQTNE
jgi:hypothetical protein